MAQSFSRRMGLSYCVLMALISYTYGQSLTSSESVVKRPGESVTLSCSVSGFSMSTYWIHWIRQKPGKGLEWIGYIDGGTRTYFAQSLQGQFSISKDNSKNMLYLEIKKLKPENTAVYYCARALYNSNPFDYWGKGTQVTVSSGGQTKPSSPLLGVYQCDSSGDYLSVGCIASGFSPAETLKFTWSSGTSDVVQYPAVQSGGTFSAVSKASVKRTEWDSQKQYFCTAEHPAGNEKLTVVKPSKPVVPEQPPTLLLTAPTQGDLENGTATFICVASQFTPKDHSFTWKRDNAELTGRAKPTILNEEKSTVTVYNAISILELQAEEWLDMSSTIKCEFKHKGKIYSKEAKVADVTESEKVVITPPSSEDMLVRGAGDLQCKATGRKGFKGIRWTRGGKNITSTVEGQIDGSSMKATAKIDYSDWSKGTEYKCVVEHKLFPGVSKEYPYSRQNGGAKMCPSVYLLPPPESALDEWVTLTCYVKHFYPKDVVVYWLTDNEKLNNTDDFQQRTSNPIEVEKDVFGTDTKYSVYSQLVMKAGVWESGTPFTCIVFHEAINPIIRTISRSIDSSTNKPTLVNIQMNVPTLPGCMA